MVKRKPSGQDSSPEVPKVILELITYNKEKHDKFDCHESDELLSKIQPDRVNWINVDGLNNQDIIEKLQARFNLHSLLIDDLLSDQRPKAEEYEGYLFFTMKMLYRIEARVIDYEQIKKIGLTQREHDVLVKMAEGLSNLEIAQQLFLSESTVKTHVSNILFKLDAKRRTQAIQSAKKLKIVS